MDEMPRSCPASSGPLPLSGEALAGLMSAVLAKGKPLRFEARGESMHPSVRDGDILTVAPLAGRSLRPGDIVAFVHPETGGVRVHRVVGLEPGRFILKGDNALGADPAVGPEAILGLVVGLERGGRPLRLRPAILAAALARLSRSSWFTRLIRRVRRTVAAKTREERT
jgi:Peptidase S24-like